VSAFADWYQAKDDLRDAEDDRLGHAIALSLTRPELVRASQDRCRPFASSSIRTLRLLYVLADRGVRPARDVARALLTHAAESSNDG
jgi:hypothetical protein